MIDAYVEIIFRVGVPMFTADQTMSNCKRRSVVLAGIVQPADAVDDLGGTFMS
jgi:hypothetical protein